MSSPAGIHVWHHCHHCGSQPIVGTRHECSVCPAGPDRDLCSRCHGLLASGGVEHPRPGSYVQATAGIHAFEPHEGAAEDTCRAWLGVGSLDAPPPKVPDGFVVRPEFCSGYESSFGSHAFVATPGHGVPPVVLTALHVMDELIRKKRIDCGCGNPSYSGHELPAAVTGINLYDVFAPNWMLAHIGSGGPMLVLPDARLGDDEPESWRDLAAFRLDLAPRLTPLELADEPPDIGEPVWLAAAHDDGSRAGLAVVVERTEKTFVYRFDGAAAGPRYSSGAPLMDRDGRVVGLNVGAGRFEGARFGHGNHVASIRRHLRSSRT